MKFVLMALIALNTLGCATTSQQWVWNTDGMDQAALAKMQAAHRECGDFAYRSRVAGSRYTQDDIQLSCMQRQGYGMKQAGR